MGRVIEQENFLRQWRTAGVEKSEAKGDVVTLERMERTGGAMVATPTGSTDS
jgi:hypothetical protein